MKNDKLDRLIEMTFEAIALPRLQESKLNSLDDIFDKSWLREWLKHGCPVEKNSHYVKQQELAKEVFADILQEREFV